MRVKICGIASEADVRAVVPAHPRYAGFLVGLDYDTDDAVSVEVARRLAEGLPPGITPVLVTHETGFEEVAALAVRSGFAVVQLHGEFPPERIPGLRTDAPAREIWRVVHVLDRSAVGLASEVARYADAVVLDTRTAGRLGGTGRTHDWTISAEIVRTCAKPVVLAGGLTPWNVAEAVATVRPWCVDVNSGVEDAGGRKDPERVGRFARRATAAASGEPSGRT
jgi:phosphoribosylanthranilate isomerase